MSSSSPSSSWSGSPRCEIFDPLLCERFGRYGTYAEESVADEFGSVLPQRYDAAVNFVRTGGRFARREPVETLAASTPGAGPRDLALDPDDAARLWTLSESLVGARFA
jgi:hypothetical protein